MPQLFSYRDSLIYCHHSVDQRPDPAAFSMHAHEWMEILLFISGKGSYLVEGYPYPLEPYDILLLRSAETHKLVISPEEPYERMAIHFAPEFLLPVDPELKLLRPFLDRPLGRQNLYPAAATPSLHDSFSAFTFEDVTDIPLNVMGRLLILLTRINGIFEQSYLRQPNQTQPNPLVDYVNEHLFEDISLQSVSEAFFLSRSQISRLFRQATGSSLWEYVTIKRLLAAQAMLQRGESAGKACTVCGFSDYSTFYRAYCSHFGHSPREDALK